jgi:hypothetical protein
VGHRAGGPWRLVVVAFGFALAACGSGVERAERPEAGTASDQTDAPMQFEEGEEATVRGVVVENTIDPCLFPDAEVICEEGIGRLLRLEVDRSPPVAVHYAGHHAEPCPNPDANRQAESARVGTTVEVFAEVEAATNERVTLSVCGDLRYYVRAMD